jgi:hypothetical protein
VQPLPDRYISARRNCAFGSSNLPNIEARWSSTKASPSLLLEAFGCTVGLDSEHLHHFIPEVIDSFTAIRPFLGLSNRREVSLVNVFLADRRLPSFVEFPLIKERIETELNPPSPPPESGLRGPPKETKGVDGYGESGKDACRPGSPSHKKGGKPGCNSLPPLSTARSETGESKAIGLSSISPA